MKSSTRGCGDLEPGLITWELGDYFEFFFGFGARAKVFEGLYKVSRSFARPQFPDTATHARFPEHVTWNILLARRASRSEAGSSDFDFLFLCHAACQR